MLDVVCDHIFVLGSQMSIKHKWQSTVLQQTLLAMIFKTSGSDMEYISQKYTGALKLQYCSKVFGSESLLAL